MPATTQPASDEMVEIARLISLAEALTVQAMVDAAGIACHVGGWWHHSIEIIGLALGGFRLTVPRIHYEDASALIRDYLAEPIGTAAFFAQRRRVIRLLTILGATIVLPAMLVMRLGTDPFPWWQVAGVPLSLLATPVPPQGSGDYYLAAKPDT